jgi:hypothetical protein
MCGGRQRLAVLASLLVLALLAWVTFTSASPALQARTGQQLGAGVSSEVAWGSANGCMQNIQINDFGELTPAYASPTLGAFAALPLTSASSDGSGDHVWVGCVTSNTALNSVVARAVADMKDAKGDVLLAGDVSIGITNQPGGLDPAGCAIRAGQSASDSCQLPNDGATTRTLVGEVPAGTTELNWQYQLELPAKSAGRRL